MGYGSYSHDAHVALTQGRAAASQSEIFTQRGCHPSMDPRGVTFRESRDSEAHPESVGVVFALDVSGSMGEIPHKLATETLPGFMQSLLDAGVAHAQVCFFAVGYAGGDNAPLQVGQFESTETLMDQWLTRMYLEGGGGGGNESYELAMYFAARHTVQDGVEKRGRRGYLFITGDEPPNPVVSTAHVQRVLHETIPADIPTADIIEEVGRTYEVFYIIPDTGRAAPIERAWRDLLGSRVIIAETPGDVGHVCAGIVSLLEGAARDLHGVADRLRTSGLATDRMDAVLRALTPFAAALGRDGVPGPAIGTRTMPQGPGSSGLTR
jgi:hypothetical protein